VDRGDPAMGAKLGMTSRIKRAMLGVDQPVSGWLTAGMVLSHGQPVPLEQLIHPQAEPEIAVLLGKEPTWPATVTSVLSAIEAVFAAIEIIDSRFEDFRYRLADVIADNVGAARVAFGSRACTEPGQQGREPDRRGRGAHPASVRADHRAVHRDGVQRHRSRINIPLDCRDGVCGTCKSFCESGRYEHGEYIVDEAMTEDEDAEGYVLTCQMVPESDCVVRIFATSDIAKTGASSYAGRISAIDRLSETTLSFSIELDDREALGFLPGQYVNIAVPDSEQTRSYSFSSPPAAAEVSFLLRDTTTGALPTFLRGSAEVGHRIEFHGPARSLLPA
jgi:ferredoxin